MGQLRDVFGICAITIKEMASLDELFELPCASSVVISWTHFDQIIANRRSRNNDNWYLILDAQTDLVENVPDGICDLNADYFASIDSLGSFFTLGDFDA